MQKWNKIKFSAIARLTKGISYTSNDYCGEEEGAIFITLKCIAKEGGFSKRGLKYYKGILPKNALLKTGDLLFANTDLTRDGDIVGCPVFLPDFGSEFPVTMSMDLSRVDFLDDSVAPSFIYYKMMTDDVRRFMKDNSSGSTVLHLNTAKVYDLLLCLPGDKSEQMRIAQILSKADEAITQTEALIAKCQRIKTGLMQDLLTKGIDEHGKIRSKETHRFVVKNGIDVPEEWEVDRLGIFLESIEQGWSPDCENEPAPTNEWGVLKTTSVTWLGYNQDENKRLPDKFTPKTNYEIKPGDVLITRAGPNSRVGVVAYVNQTRSRLILSDKIYRLKPKKELLPDYLALALSSPSTQRHLSNLKTGMAESQTNISQKIVSALNIAVPQVGEQKMIKGKLNSIDQLVHDYQRSLEKLKAVKTGLMQDLLSGKVRVQVKEELLQ